MASTTSGFQRRRVWWVVLSLCALLLILVTVALLPPVQRWVVLAVARNADLALGLDRLAVSPWHMSIRGLQLEHNGVKVAVPRARARYDLFALLFNRTALLRHLRASGVMLDVRDARFAASAAASPANTTSAPVTFRFDGLRPLAQFPLPVVVQDLNVSGGIRASVSAAQQPLLWTYQIDGGDIAPGHTGEVNVTAHLIMPTPKITYGRLVARGHFTVAQSHDARLEGFTFAGDLYPTGPHARRDQGLGARLELGLKRPEETYRLRLLTLGETDRRAVLTVDLQLRPATRVLALSWQADLDRSRLQPFLEGLAAPAFAFQGQGELDYELDTGTMRARAELDLSGSGWGTLHPSLAAIGPLRLVGQGSIGIENARLVGESVVFRIDDAEGTTVLHLGTEQAFSVDLKARHLAPDQYGQPLLRFRLDRFPLTWMSSLSQQVDLQEGVLGGEFVLTFEAAKHIQVRTIAPLIGRQVRLATLEARHLPRLNFRLTPAAVWTPGQLQANLTQTRVAFASGQQLDFDGGLTLPLNERPVADLNGSLALHLPELSAAIKGLQTLQAQGHMRLDLGTLALALQRVTFGVTGRKGARLMQGSFTTIQPLTISLETFEFELDRFEPDALTWSITGFPVSWVSSFLPEFTVTTGELHGEFRATGSTDKGVLVTNVKPFEVRNFGLSWHGRQMLDKVTMGLRPAFTLSPEHIAIQLDAIRLRTPTGERLDAKMDIRVPYAEQDNVYVAGHLETALPSLLHRPGHFGAFAVTYGTTLNLAARTLDVKSMAFAFKDARGRDYLSGRNLHPFQVAMEPFGVSPLGTSSELFQATFTPLELSDLLGQPLGLNLVGHLPDGNVLITAQEGRLVFRTERPLTLGPISVRWDNTLLLDQLTFTIEHELSYSAAGFEAHSMLLNITGRDQPILSVSTHGVLDLTAQNRGSRFESNWRLHPSAFFRQPLGRGLPQYTDGIMSSRVVMQLAPRLTFDYHLSLEGLVAQENGKRLPDLSLRAQAIEEREGLLRIEAPLRIQAIQATSDLMLRGSIEALGDRHWSNFSLTSEQLVVHDIVELIDTLFPEVENGSVVVPARPDPEQGVVPPDPHQMPVQETQTMLERLIHKRDSKPFWSSELMGQASVDVKQIKVDQYAITGVRGSLELDDQVLKLQEVQAEFLGARFGAFLDLTFDSTRGMPYQLSAGVNLHELEMGRLFSEVDPDTPPALEGIFNLESELRGAGINLLNLLDKSHAVTRIKGQRGMFRGLQQDEAKKLSFLAGVAGTLLFSPEFRAVGRLVRQLAAFPFDTMAIEIARTDPQRVQMQSLHLLADEFEVQGEGGVTLLDDQPLTHSPLDLTVRMATKGDMAILFDGMKLLEKQPDARGYRALRQPFVIAGTLAAPDASALYAMFDEAAQNAGGAFGLVLRGVNKKLRKSEKTQDEGK